MSGAERSYRFALLAFPKPYREERGEEIVATVLEGGDGWAPRLREFFGLFFAGVGQRSLRAGGEKTASSVRAGIRLGAYFLLWLKAVDATAGLVHFENLESFGRYELIHSGGAVVIGVIVLLTLSRGWWVAPIALVLGWEYLVGGHVSQNIWLSVLGFLPALLCLLARPRKHEPRDLRSPLWAIAAPALGALMGWQWQALYTNFWVGLLYIALLATWLVLGWRDLRLAIAVATIVSFFGLSLFWQFSLRSIPLDSPIRLIAYAFFLGAAVATAIGLGGRRANA
jgi:hypothetical protein